MGIHVFPILNPPPTFLLWDIKDWCSLEMEKAMAPHSRTLAWKIPWTEEPGRLQSMGSLESDTTERLHFYFSLSCIGEGNGNPLQCSCLENPRDGGAWWAAVYGVAQSRTRLKWLSSSSSLETLKCHLVVSLRKYSRKLEKKKKIKANIYKSQGMYFYVLTNRICVQLSVWNSHLFNTLFIWLK